MLREIDYNKLLENIDSMLNLLEYDAMRSHGKAKANSNDLYNLYELKDRYEAKLKSAKTKDDSSTRKKVKAVAAD